MRNPEEELDSSIFDEMEQKDVIDYIEGKYSQEVADAIILLLNKQ